VTGISLSRGISRETVKQLIDDTIVTGAAAKDRGLVDHLIDADGLRQLIKEEVGNDVNLVHNYGAPKRELVDFSNPFALLASLSKKARNVE
jgi:ClpP class serine protease